MRGIMTARTKALTILEPVAANVNTKAVKFEKPAAKSAVKLISADNLDELINLLHRSKSNLTVITSRSKSKVEFYINFL
jgi:electron transfer flavoprotein beta subunit